MKMLRNVQVNARSGFRSGSRVQKYAPLLSLAFAAASFATSLLVVISGTGRQPLLENYHLITVRRWPNVERIAINFMIAQYLEHWSGGCPIYSYHYPGGCSVQEQETGTRRISTRGLHLLVDHNETIQPFERNHRFSKFLHEFPPFVHARDQSDCKSDTVSNNCDHR